MRFSACGVVGILAPWMTSLQFSRSTDIAKARINCSFSCAGIFGSPKITVRCEADCLAALLSVMARAGGLNEGGQNSPSNHRFFVGLHYED